MGKNYEVEIMTTLTAFVVSMLMVISTGLKRF